MALIGMENKTVKMIEDVWEFADYYRLKDIENLLWLAGLWYDEIETKRNHPPVKSQLEGPIKRHWVLVNSYFRNLKDTFYSELEVAGRREQAFKHKEDAKNKVLDQITNLKSRIAKAREDAEREDLEKEAKIAFKRIRMGMIADEPITRGEMSKKLLKHMNKMVTKLEFLEVYQIQHLVEETEDWLENSIKLNDSDALCDFVSLKKLYKAVCAEVGKGSGRERKAKHNIAMTHKLMMRIDQLKGLLEQPA